MKHLWFMWHNGMSWTGEGYYGYINKRKLNRVIEYCKEQHLQYTLNGEFSERSTGYRKTFFQNNLPFVGERYFCAYCGRLIKKEKVTVDHLYPVGAAKRSMKLQKKLKRMGIDNINDAKNLVPACKHCNSKKGRKMGQWIIRGRIGRHPYIWVVRHSIRIYIIILLAGYFAKTEFAADVFAVFRVAMGF